MKTITAEKALTKLSRRAERIKTNETQRFPDAASPGDAFRQGDLYITLLDDLPNSDEIIRVERPVIQLAPGATQGARHCLDALDGVSMFRLLQPSEFDGPIMRLATERTVTHPEHGHVVLPPGLYQVTYQRNLDAEERAQRVLD